MSPMWLTSKTPTLPRTALCSAIKPPLDGYSTGISQPPKLTIFAPRRRCNAFRGVLRSSLMREIVEDSIPIARAGTDTNMHLGSGQRSLALIRIAGGVGKFTAASLFAFCLARLCSGIGAGKGIHGRVDSLVILR